MEQLIQFLINHWELSLALIIILIFLIILELKDQKGSGRLSPGEMTRLINQERAVVIDIRERDAFVEGHVINAINIPQADLLTSVDKLKKYQDKPLILLCNAGQNSVAMVIKLQKAGFIKVYSLVGGLQAWKAAGLPIVKS